MAYIPDRGHLVWLSFTPQSGHEQAGRRQALVVSPQPYNSKSGLLVACPVTSKVKGYPFEVALPEGLPIAGVVLSDQLRSLDWRSRKAEVICEAPAGIVADVLAKATALLHAQ